MRSDDIRIASLATVPMRRKGLPIVLESLVGQVDEIRVYLNGHQEVPECVLDFGCTVARSTKHGDRGDGGKFFWAGQHRPAWYLTCDDDFEYAPNYVESLIQASMRLQAAVSLHGVVLSNALAAGRHVDWLKQGRARWLRACDRVHEDTPVHVLGTGVACHHSSLVRVSKHDFPQPHSADIWFSSLCQKQRVRRYVPRHPPALAVQTAPPLPAGPKKLRWNGEYARRAASRAPWRLHTEQDL